MDNCTDCRFLIEREKGGELEWFCRVLPGQRCMGVTKCSAWEKKEVKPEPKTKT